MLYKGFDIIATSVYALNGRLTYYSVIIITPSGRTLTATSERKAREIVDEICEARDESARRERLQEIHTEYHMEGEE